MAYAYIAVLIAFSIMAILRLRYRHVLALWVLFGPCLRVLQWSLLVMTGTRSVRYDEWFYLADRWLGSPSWALARMLNALPALRFIAIQDYAESTAIIMVSITALALMGRTPEAWRAFAATLLAGAVAPFTYKLLPASGPAYAFSGFPYHLPVITSPHAILLSAAPNCMPSMHIVSALLVCYFLRHWRIGRWVGGLHVALTILATLGLGEHYAIDLVVAVPYAACVLWLIHANVVPGTSPELAAKLSTGD